jgi:FAD/FMN-containing dehydrogenase/Fe-S oxidoreductase
MDLQTAFESQIDGEVRFDTISRAIYATDASVYQIMPLGVVIPKCRDDVLATLRICREYGASITARGGGTSQAGQAIGPGVQLDFSKYMNRVVEFDPDEHTVRVQPGIVLDELNAFLKPYGLHLPLDLSTSNRATIGGMIANNSAGTRSVVYGKTIDYVLELMLVLADGSVVELRELDEDELAAKREQDDLEGSCYRVVRKLADEHADEIERRYPKILRRVGGYNLDEFSNPKRQRGTDRSADASLTRRVTSQRSFNLAKLIVGSEGTLALALEAKLRLVPLPKARVVCVVQFDDLLQALAATPAILAHEPSAVELVDRFILDTTRGKPKFEPLRDFIVGDPEAVLIVEFFGEADDELPHRVDRLEEDLRDRDLGNHFHRAMESDAQSRIWQLRRAALGLSMSQRGDAKAISFVEDTAVAPDRLRDYIERFREILARNETQAGFYAHASVGLLHIRPVVDMKSADGVERFRRVAEEISDLVLEFGGALSGEHGDGLVRSPFQVKMFGPVLYEAFCEIKCCFDPDGLLNPGKIVHAPPITDHLRFGANYETPDVETMFDFEDFGGLSRAAEQCGGVGACRKTLSGTMCPSYMATREEADSTRGRANALRLAISGQLGDAGFTDEELYPILDLCLECKACKTECPTGVDMARIKSEFLYQFYQRSGKPRRAKLLANAERLAAWGSRTAPASNWIVQSQIARWLNERLFGLDRRRIPPSFARLTFLRWWKRHSKSSPKSDNGRPQIALFADTFTNYHEPEHAIASVQVAEALGARITVPPRVCCGRPLISKGFLDQARQQAETTTRTLLPLAEAGTPIVFCEPSCYSAVRDDHPCLLRGERKQQAEVVATACVTFEEWAADVLSRKSVELHSPDGPTEILVHGHCHQKSLVGMGSTIRLLSAISDCTMTDLETGCCGMAGSFGYEREHYDISQTIGNLKLFPAIDEKPEKAVVVAPGFSCRHQIKHFTGVEAMSSATLLRSLISHDGP